MTNTCLDVILSIIGGNMNIAIYGHSMATWQRQQPFSYITKIRDHFHANIIHTGVAMCSQERILFNLKKTKNLDLAIIFHSSPDYIFVPVEQRDFCTVDRDVLIAKVPSGRAKDWFKLHGLESVPDDMCEFWEKIPNMACFEILKDFGIVPHFDESNKIENLSNKNREAFLKWIDGNPEFVKNVMKENQNLKSEIDYYIGLFDALYLHKKYLYNHDLQMNRYYGALIQIDQYLKAKSIPVVHCLGKPFWYPNWFTFESGVTSGEIYKLRHEIHGYYAEQKESDNSMTPEGNQLAFDMLVPLIHRALEKVK